MQAELIAAFIGWGLLFIVPRWWLLLICGAGFLFVVGLRAVQTAGDMVVYAMLGVVPLFAAFFLIIGAIVVASRKAMKPRH